MSPHNSDTHSIAYITIAQAVNDAREITLTPEDVEHIIENHSARHDWGDDIEVLVLAEALEFGIKVDGRDWRVPA